MMCAVGVDTGPLASSPAMGQAWAGQVRSRLRRSASGWRVLGPRCGMRRERRWSSRGNI